MPKNENSINKQPFAPSAALGVFGLQADLEGSAASLSPFGVRQAVTAHTGPSSDRQDVAPAARKTAIRCTCSLSLQTEDPQGTARQI